MDGLVELGIFVLCIWWVSIVSRSKGPTTTKRDSGPAVTGTVRAPGAPRVGSPKVSGGAQRGAGHSHVEPTRLLTADGAPLPLGSITEVPTTPEAWRKLQREYDALLVQKGIYGEVLSEAIRCSEVAERGAKGKVAASASRKLLEPRSLRAWARSDPGKAARARKPRPSTGSGGARGGYGLGGELAWCVLNEDENPRRKDIEEHFDEVYGGGAPHGLGSDEIDWGAQDYE